MKAVTVAVGRALRETGQALDRAGSMLQGNYAFKESLSRHRRIMPLDELRPAVSEDAFVAPNASVIGELPSGESFFFSPSLTTVLVAGDVSLGHRVVVWYGAVLRGDRSAIRVGEGSSIGDRVVAHGTVTQSVSIGQRVTVGQGAVLHGCTVADDVVIGPNALVFGAVEKQAQVAPGALVLETVKSGQLWGGQPARFVRDLTTEEIASFSALASTNGELAKKHKEEHDRSEAQRQHRRDYDDFNTGARTNVYHEHPF